MQEDLIARYLYAVTRRMNPKIREDVTRELRGLIEDMLSERCGTVPPTEKDVRVVLTELGSPQELYEKYDESSKKCLIGQPYYGTWCLVLKVVLPCVVLGLGIAGGILWLLEPKPWYAAIGETLAMMYQASLAVFAFVTVLFAVFYRRGTPIYEPFNFDDLPPVPKKQQCIPRWEPLVSMSLCALFTVLFLAAPQIFGSFVRGEGLIPLFWTQAVRESWYCVVLLGLLGILREACRLRVGRYNRRVLLSTLVTDAASVAVVIWWLAGHELMNPAFLSWVERVFADEEVPRMLFSHFQRFFLGIYCFALGLDALETTVRTLKK